jgi:Primase X
LIDNTTTTIDKDTAIGAIFDIILDHLNDPLFPRTIMTKTLGYQKEVFNKQEALARFKAANYQDCRINAYPSHTEYAGFNLTPTSFIMIDLDLKDFGYSQEKLEKILRTTLNKINNVFHGAHPTVLWTGNGYHIYQPIHGFILEEIDRFASCIDPSKKDLTRLMQFAEDFFTEKKGDPQHRPSIKSCLIRIPGTMNSKCNQEVKIVQRWDGTRPPINYLLRDFRIWLVTEKINDKQEESKMVKYRNSSRNSYRYYNTNTIPWIEKLLQTPITDYRKYALWRILMPYLFNVKKLSDTEVIDIMQTWLNKCNHLRSLDFNAKYLIKQNIRNSKKNRYLPISFDKLSSENKGLHDIIS